MMIKYDEAPASVARKALLRASTIEDILHTSLFKAPEYPDKQEDLRLLKELASMITRARDYIDS